MTEEYRDMSAEGTTPDDAERVLRAGLEAYDLDEADLVRILTEPKNALVRQYQKLFELDHVQLRFTPNALKAIAARAIERKTGARGLRNVMERTMLDIMFRLPSMPGVKECLINRAVIEKGKEPVLLYDESAGGAAADTSLN